MIEFERKEFREFREYKEFKEFKEKLSLISLISLILNFEFWILNFELKKACRQMSDRPQPI